MNEFKHVHSKIVGGSLGGSRMEWFCGEFEDSTGKRYIGCFDVTVIAPERDRPNGIFFVSKGQPPGGFDFMPHAYDTYEQIWLAQRIVHDWDSIRDGDVLTATDEEAEKIRMARGILWLPGKSVSVEKEGENAFRLKEEPFDRELGRGGKISRGML